MIEVKETSSGRAWQQVARMAAAKGSKELLNLSVTITGAPICAKELSFQQLVSEALLADSKPKVSTVANTIFPASLWREGMDRAEFYSRYLYIWPRLEKKPGNARGTYFKRLIAYPGPEHRSFNQLEHVMRTYQKGIRRRSTLQCSIINPALDLRATPYQGFPCLQQLAFQPSKTGLRLVAFYPTQYIWRRAYGNYVGLLSLGRFVADQLEMSFEALTCISLSAQLEGPKYKASSLKALLDWSF